MAGLLVMRRGDQHPSGVGNSSTARRPRIGVYWVHGSGGFGTASGPVCSQTGTCSSNIRRAALSEAGTVGRTTGVSGRRRRTILDGNWPCRHASLSLTDRKTPTPTKWPERLTRDADWVVLLIPALEPHRFSACCPTSFLFFISDRPGMRLLATPCIHTVGSSCAHRL